MTNQTIYLFNHNGNKYVGSTKDLSMRMWAHNQHFKQTRHNKTKLYRYMIENDITDIRKHISILETCKDAYNKYNLRCIEQSYLDELKPNLNMIKALKPKKNV